tara:strand:- start:15 stop:527 length:513 start_codon:yes stop_codon:yes gene_type:complete
MNWYKTSQYDDDVPSEPGSTPIPADHVRLYHYTNDNTGEAADRLRNNGIDIGKAKGSTYGEPNAVWASSAMPGQHKVFAEFSVDRNDPRWAIGKVDEAESVEEYAERRWDVTFLDSIRPEEIIAVHEPWHYRYRYMLNNPGLIEEVKRGEFDHLLDSPDYGPAIMKAKSS